MQARRFLAALVAIPVFAVLVGCQPGAESPTTTPTSRTTVPTTASPPTTPSQEDLLRQASEVHGAIFAEINRLEGAGGAKELPASLKRYVTGELEKNLVTLYVTHWPSEGKVRTGPAPTLQWVRPREVDKAGALVATIGCVDATKSRFSTRRETSLPGIIQTQIFRYAFFGGEMKAFSSDFERVTKC